MRLGWKSNVGLIATRFGLTKRRDVYAGRMLLIDMTDRPSSWVFFRSQVFFGSGLRMIDIILYQ